jgi:hypothetical protein
MTTISHMGPAGSLIGTFHEATTAFIQSWTSGYTRRREQMRDLEELRGLDPRMLADLGVEFAPEYGPSMLHSQAEAMAAAAEALAGFGNRRR